MANPISTVAAQLAQYVDPKSTGGAWAASGYGPQGMLEQLAQRLINKTGITNLNDMVIDTKSFPLTVPVVRYDDEYGTAWYKVLGRDVETGNPSQIEPLTPEELRNVKVESSWDPELGGRAYYSLDTTENITGIYNKNTGALITGQKFIDLDGWAAGEGWTSGILRFDNDNKPRVTTYGADSGDLGKILPVISIALLAVPGLGQAVGSALLPSGVSAATATAVGNAVINAGVQVASGVPVEKAIVNSAASLGVSQIVPNLSGNVFVDNAVKSVATAALTGGNVENALANSLIATGGNELLGNATFTGDKVVDSAIASAITSGVQAAATGGDVGASIIRGGISGATGQLTKEEKATESAKSGAGFIGEGVVDSVAGAISNDSIPAGVGVDTVGGIAGADTVNAGVAENDVLDLIQKDIDTSVANNTQGTLNAEQDLGIPPIDPRIAAQGVAGGQFGEGELLQAGAQIPVNRLQELMQIRPDLVTMSDTGTYLVTVPQSDGAYTNYEISASGQVLSATPGVSVGPGKDPSKAASALEDVIKIEEGRSSTQAVPEGSGSSGSVQQKATDLSPAAQETLLQIGGVLGLGEQDPDAVYEALIGGASGGIGDVALLGYDQLTKLQDEIELIFDEPNLPADARSEIARIYAEVTDQKRIQEEAIRDQLLNDQKPTEQQVADTGLTVVGQPVNETTVVSPTTPSVTTPTTSPVVTEPVVTQPVVPEPVVTQPPVNEPVVTEPVVTEPLITQPVITQPVVTTPPVLTPEQIAAQELEAEVQKIMRMAVKIDPVDMRYDLNKDGKVNVFDAVLLKRGQATVPTVEEYQASLAQQTVAPQPEIVEPPITQPAVTEPVTQEPPTQDIVTTAPSTTPPVTQPVEQTPSVEPPPPPPIVEPTPPTSEVTGIVLQNNGDGTALVLTNDGNATNVPVTDAVSNEPLTPGASVTVDQNTNTATITPPVTNVVTPEPVTPVPPTVQDTGNQQVIGGGQEPTTDAGTVINTPIGPDTYTPPTPEPVVPEPPPPPPEVPTTPQEPITQPPQEPTEEDLLLEQIIQELETKPPVSEGVPIPEPEFPEPPLVLPESPTINVGDSLTVRPRVERRATRPSVPPGSRVEESAQILPIRPGLSEGGTGGIEGTTEQEQEPVWNVRSLKLRRLLGI
jgi:Proteasomal ATPase OB C-terminal domain